MVAGIPSNEVLRRAFKVLHHDIISKNDIKFVIDHLPSAKILCEDDIHTLMTMTCEKTKVSHMMALLHATQNPMAFHWLYQKLKNANNWLIKTIDELCVNGTVLTPDVAGCRQKCKSHVRILYDDRHSI